MKIYNKATKEEVRKWIMSRAKEKTPLPEIDKIKCDVWNMAKEARMMLS